MVEERRRRGFWEGDEGHAKGFGKDKLGEGSVFASLLASLCLSHNHLRAPKSDLVRICKVFLFYRTIASFISTIVDLVFTAGNSRFQYQ